jgi:enoyl-CoA hydratase/carnithine racemase
MDPLVHLEVDDGVAIVRMQQPPANQIDLAMGLALQDMIRDVGERRDVGALVITGGPKIFAAGADIKAMASWGPGDVKPSVDALGDACDLVAASPKISIAAINGYALGGGLELALACDFRYVADDATVGLPEITLGVIPGAGGTQRLTALAGPSVAASLIFTGRRVGPEEAVGMGLADRILAPGDVLDAAVADARGFARGPRTALAAAKAAIRAAAVTPGPEAIREERHLFLQLFGTADQREGMRAFLEKRAPRFGGEPQ